MKFFFQISDLNCDVGSNGYCEESADHPDEGRQIGASVSLLLALSMLDGWVLVVANQLFTHLLIVSQMPSLG